MSTPEKPRPSLDDTLAHIDEAIDALAAEMAAQPDCRRCARRAVIGYELCAYHLQLDPREMMIEDLGPDDRSAEFFDLLARDRSLIDSVTEAPLIPRERTYVAFDEPYRGGWLARALHRLFGDGAP